MYSPFAAQKFSECVIAVYGTAQVQGNVQTRQKRIRDASETRSRHVQGTSGTNAIPHDKAARQI